MLPEVSLTQVSIDDVSRIIQWLEDGEVNSSWYGVDEEGEPLHIGYSPKHVLQSSFAYWEETFEGDARKIYSVHMTGGQHIGEAQMAIEAPLYEAQLFILIGRKDLWYKGYGTAAFVELLDLAFGTFGLHRAWVDLPDYNLPAIHMCERIGFVLEGHLRRTHRKEGQWYDSLAMGLLADEYRRRRSKLLDAEPTGQSAQ